MGTQMLSREPLNLPTSCLSVGVSGPAWPELGGLKVVKTEFDSLDLRIWGQQVAWSGCTLVGGGEGSGHPRPSLQGRMQMGLSWDWHTDGVQLRLVKKSSPRGTCLWLRS